MPKSRGRRPRRTQHNTRNRHRTRASRSTTASAADRAAAIANFPVLRAVDAAEAEGDAYKAMLLIEGDLAKRGMTETFWHPERLTRLTQIVVYRSVFPGWATSRWILAQAVRWMDSSQRRRFTRAFDRTVEVAGGPERYGGVDEIDSSCKLMDRDWVYRQLVLYEYGGLQHFLDRVASRTLVERADSVRDWAATPMGAYRLTARTPRSVGWLELSSGGEIETANIGSASLLDVGEHAIGRLVPTGQGPMFESAPLFVPPDVATWVADAPYDWMCAVERGCQCEAPPALRISTPTPGFPLLSDVPIAQQHALIESILDPSDQEALGWSADDLRDAQVAVVRAALEEQPDFGDWPFEPWPVVGSLLLDPVILVELGRHPCAGECSGLRADGRPAGLARGRGRP